MGLVIGAPGVSLGGSTNLTYESISQTGGTTADVYFRDESANFKNTVPLSAKYGISYEFSDRAAIEVDAKFHNSVPTYNIYSSDQSATVTTTDATGAATTSSIPFPTIAYKTLAVVNGAIGGHYKLNDTLKVHAGFFSSRTPVDDSDNAVFRKVNLYAGILGVSLHATHLSGSVGGQYQWGTTDSFSRAGVLGGPAVTSQVAVRSFSFQYAISYGF
jgi:long-subunit fatty acid transport protein